VEAPLGPLISNSKICIGLMLHAPSRHITEGCSGIGRDIFFPLSFDIQI
jgi:hypothetical protein